MTAAFAKMPRAAFADSLAATGNRSSAAGIAAMVAAAGAGGDELANGALLRSLDRMRVGLSDQNRRDPAKLAASTILVPFAFPGQTQEPDPEFQVAALKLLTEFGALDAVWALRVALRTSLGPTVVQALVDLGGLHRPAGENNILGEVQRADVARVLLAAGCDPNAGGGALHMQWWSGGPKIVAALLEGGADVNAVAGSHAYTPLRRLLAVTRMEAEQRIVLARLLLDAGADPTIPDAHGVSALAAAEAHLATCVRHGGAVVEDVAHARSLVRMLARGAVWVRRRHMLLAVRGRYDTPAAACSGATAGAAAGAAAACGDGATATL